MTRSDAFRQLSDIVNHYLIPIVRNGNLEQTHRVYVENFIQQLYDTLNTALKNSDSSLYKVKFETDYGANNEWALSIEVGKSPVPPNSHFVFYYIQGDKDICLDLSKTDTWYDSTRKSRSQNEYICFNVDPDDKQTQLSLKATRDKDGRGRLRWVFNYVNGQPAQPHHEDCEYRDYL